MEDIDFMDETPFDPKLDIKTGVYFVLIALGVALIASALLKHD